MQRNLKQLFLNVTYFKLTGEECRIYLFIFLIFIFTSYPRNIHEKKIYTHETSTRKNVGPTKYPRKKLLDPRNTHEKKSYSHEREKLLEPTKYPRQKILDLQNIREKNLEPMKYSRKKGSDPRNTHEKEIGSHEISTRKKFRTTNVRWHDGTRHIGPPR